jgi:hypothetical protein
MLQHALGSAGISDLIDKCLSIEEVRVYKPDPAAYQIATSALKLQSPGEACFFIFQRLGRCRSAHVRVSRFLGQPLESTGRIRIAQKRTEAQFVVRRDRTPRFLKARSHVSRRVPNNWPSQIFIGDLNPMRDTEMHPGDVERFAKLLGLHLAAGDSQPIAALLTEIRGNVLKKASALKQDAPLAVYFDAR